MLGAFTVHVVACVAQLYTAAIVHHVLVYQILSAQFALNVAVYVTAFLFVIA